MPRTVAELLEAAMALPEPERAELAEVLAASVDAPPKGLHPDWDAEVRRRAAEVETGTVKAIPLEESLRRVQALIDARKADG